VSLISARHICDECGGYRIGFKSSLSSACTCPGVNVVEPQRHQIGAPVGARTNPRWKR
jgi:hypothetical protein